MAQKFAEGMRGGVPPWKEGETIDLRVAHWCLFAPHASGMYETVRELVTAENQIEGVLAGMCETPGPGAGKSAMERAAEGGRVDPMHPDFRTQDWGWGLKYPDIHVVHTTLFDRIGELEPKVFFSHGTPEACLENDLMPNLKSDSYGPGIRYIERCDATIVTSKRQELLWSPYDHSGDKIHRVDKGIDLEWWRKTFVKQELPGEPSVLYGEIWRGIKHPFHILFAVNEIYKRNPKVKLNAWGCNIKKPFWQKLFEESNFDNFLGPRGIKDIVDYPEHYYSRGDVLANPVIYGDVTRVGQEALACGCPNVAWDTDPFGDTHAYATAKAFDISDFAAKIEEIYEDLLDDGEAVHKKAREIAETHFDINVEAKQVVEILRKTVGET